MNRVKKSGMSKRMGAKGAGSRGSQRPPGRVKGGSKRVGRTGISSPSMNAGKLGKKHEPMLNAMRADPGIVPSKGSKINKKRNSTSPEAVNKLYEGMRGD